MRRSRHLALVASAIVAATLWPEQSEAQHARHARRIRTRSVVVVGASVRPFFVPYYSPFYAGFYGPFFGPPWFPPYYPFPPYGYWYYDDRAAVRIQVEPKEADVYVDGYLAGRVDDFDGVFQRLRLPPGPHEIVVYHEGYRSLRRELHLRPDASYDIREKLEPLPAGEPDEPRPEAKGPPPSEWTRRRAPRDREPSYGATARHATVSIAVQPADAEIFIDGERWQGPASSERLDVRVSPGFHRIEIRKDGYRTFSTEIDVGPGRTERLNVSLTPDEPAG